MSTLIYAARDSTTMLRRDIRHAVRFPMATLVIPLQVPVTRRTCALTRRQRLTGPSTCEPF
jgi:hypothetical protein